MIDLLRVFVCTKCGDVLMDEVSPFEDIDTKNDEVTVYWLHDNCGHEVVPKTGENGAHVFEHVDHERWLWAVGAYDDSESEREDAESID